MSFLDNLENNLKALESREQGDIGDRRKLDEDRRKAQSEAPWADRLKKGAWTQSLMQQATRAGFQRRVKVNFIWIGTTLRLEALGDRLELRPAKDGVDAVFLDNGAETKRSKANLEAEPATLLTEFMALVDARKKREEERARQLARELAEDLDVDQTA